MPRKTPPITPELTREDYAIRIALRFPNSWVRMTPEQQVKTLQASTVFLANLREQMIDEIANLLDGAAGPIDMDLEAA